MDKRGKLHDFEAKLKPNIQIKLVTKKIVISLGPKVQEPGGLKYETHSSFEAI